MSFFAVDDRDAAATFILDHARETDVYVGCAPRTREAGTKDAIGQVWTLWAECDGAESVAALQSFDPAPSFVIGSGSGVNCHAYWPLAEPLGPAAAEPANFRLAHAIGADLACFDAGRILRPPGTWNHKRQPPARVATLHLERDARFDALAVLRNAPEVQTERIERRWTPAPTPPRAWHDDRLLKPRAGDPRHRARRTGARAQSQGLVPLPRGPNPEPSRLPHPERGMWCFSCGRGGSIYDLAAAMWGMTPRGREFIQIRERLQERFAAEMSRPRLTYGLER